MTTANARELAQKAVDLTVVLDDVARLLAGNVHPSHAAAILRGAQNMVKETRALAFDVLTEAEAPAFAVAEREA